jgi:hypothetical protein
MQAHQLPKMDMAMGFFGYDLAARRDKIGMKRCFKELVGQMARDLGPLPPQEELDALQDDGAKVRGFMGVYVDRFCAACPYISECPRNKEINTH